MDAAKESLARLIDGRAHPDMANYQKALVVASVVEWNLTGTDDAVLPLTSDKVKWASVESLPEQVFARIYAAVQEHNTDRDAEEQRNFRSPSGGRSANGKRGTASAEAVLAAESPVGDRAAT